MGSQGRAVFLLGAAQNSLGQKIPFSKLSLMMVERPNFSICCLNEKPYERLILGVLSRSTEVRFAPKAVVRRTVNQIDIPSLRPVNS